MITSPSRRLLRRFAIVCAVALCAGGISMASGATPRPHFPRTVARDVAAAGPVRHIERAISLPIRANLIGVSYVGTAGIQVSVHAPGGGWSDWQAVETSDNGPDRDTPEGRAAANGRTTTAPFWAGTADRMKLRVDSKAGVHDVRVHLVNTLGDAEPQSTVTRLFGAVGRWLAAPFAGALSPPAPAEASPAKPAFITRSQWGANETWRRCCPRYANTVEVAFVHHTDNPNNYTASQVPGILQAIYHYHRFSRDYDDIAYNFIVDRFGRVYEGRYGGIDKPVVGAHVEGMNTATTGVALLGTFSNAYMTGPMTTALETLLAWKMDVHHIPTMGTVPMTSGGSAKLRKGQVVQMNRIAGHRDAQSTDCPGGKVYAMLPKIRSTIQQWGSPKFYMNSSPMVLRPDGDGVNETVATKIWNSSSLNWKITFADATGTITSTATGIGTTGAASWDGKDAVTGAMAQTGTGSMKIDVWDAANHHATPVTIPIYVVTTHPPGTVLQSGSTVVMVDANGAARAVTSGAVYNSWFRPKEAVATGPGELARYTAGTPLGFRDGTLLKTPDGVYHFMNGGQRREFAPGLFQALGFTDAAAIAAAQTEADAIPPGAAITDATTHPDGSVVVDGNKTSWVISSGQKHKVASEIMRQSWYRDAEAVNATAGDISLPQGSDVEFRDGTLIRTPDGAVFLVWQGTRRWITSAGFMGALGYQGTNVLKVTWTDSGTLSYGQPLS